MKISSQFVRENKHYTRNGLQSLFKDISEESVDKIIRKLSEAKVLKEISRNSRDLSDLDNAEYDPEDNGSNSYEKLYMITFVGVISVSGQVLKCLPKYLLKEKEMTNAEKDQHLSKIFQVLVKYNNTKDQQNLRTLDSTDREKSFNLLPLILYLLNDYFENGLYRNTHLIIESNGSGEILWDKTVNNTYPVISDGKPYYFDLKTKKRTYDETDYFRRLHSCILTLCSKDLKEAGLLELFGLPEVHLTYENLDEFGDTEYIKYRLQKELNVVFDSRKQLLLQKMYDYIAESTSLADEDCCTFYGTNSFNLIWEEICSKILKNQRDVPLENILAELKKSMHISDDERDEYTDKRRTLLDLIDKPVWKKTGSNESFKAEATLKPDIIHITIFNDDGEFKFLIFDAKYYIMTFDETKDKGLQVKGQPGVGDITKQYLYHLAFQQFVNKHNISDVINCFIMPTEGNEVICTGTASMEMLDNIKDLKPIKIRHLPAETAFDCYLSDKPYEIGKLCLKE